ncbi:TIM barrel protein [bacterium]|nr:TIM barrel protein [bacterium]
MDINKLSINTATFKHLNLKEVADLCSKNNITAIGPWRDKVEEIGLKEAVKIIKDAGLKVSGLCRGGFFSADSHHNMDDNQRAIEQAAELGADCLVIVSGGMLPNNKRLSDSHQYIQEGLALMVEYAKSLQVPIALEPLHPMYAADRCAVNSLEQALQICNEIGEGIGLAIDSYHVWWDPQLFKLIKKAGEDDKILAYHVCDWLTPTSDMLLDRGLMGEGVIDLEAISNEISNAGYNKYVEVEIFSNRLWQLPPQLLMQKVIDAFEKEV